MTRVRSRPGWLLRGHDQGRDEDPDQREDHAVEHGVLRDEARRSSAPRWDRSTPWKVAAPSSDGVRKRAAARRIVDQEPHGDEDGPDEAGDDALAQVTVDWRP